MCISLGVFAAFVILGLGFVVVPVHVTPANGSLRCVDSLLFDGFQEASQAPDLEGCAKEEHARVTQTLMSAAGAFLFAGGWALRRGIVRLLTEGLAVVLVVIGLLGILANAMG